MVSVMAVESAPPKDRASDAAGEQLLTELAEDGLKSPDVRIITEEPSGQIREKVMKIDQGKKRKKEGRKMPKARKSRRSVKR